MAYRESGITVDALARKSIKKVRSDLAENVRHINNVSGFRYQPTLLDLYQDIMGRFFEPKKSMDIERPARTYVLKFTAAVTTTALVIPHYSQFAGMANTDNLSFKSDKAYVSEVFAVYDLTADPGRITNLYTSFVAGTHSITLSAASDNTVRTWEIVCMGVPYQGLIAPISASSHPDYTKFKVVYDPGKVMIVCDGLSNSQASPIIPRLPLDNANDSDSFTSQFRFTGTSTWAYFGFTNYEHTVGTLPPLSLPLLYSGVSSQMRGAILSGTVRRLDLTPLGGAPNPYLAVYFCIVRACRLVPDNTHDAVFKDGELLLMAITQVCTTTSPHIVTNNAGNSFDVFRLPGRPIMGGEVIVI
jgi:hypothetical protein